MRRPILLCGALVLAACVGCDTMQRINAGFWDAVWPPEEVPVDVPSPGEPPEAPDLPDEPDAKPDDNWYEFGAVLAGLLATAAGMYGVADRRIYHKAKG